MAFIGNESVRKTMVLESQVIEEVENLVNLGAKFITNVINNIKEN